MAMHRLFVRFSASARLAVAVGLLAVATSHVVAADTEAFVLKPVDGGFLRLESSTGRTSTCTGTADNLVCRSTPDERAAFENEIGRLMDENRLLATEIAAMKANGPSPSARVELKLPSEAEVDKAMGFLERMVKRFKNMLDDLQAEPGSQTPL
jgi:hypothetical protein